MHVSFRHQLHHVVVGGFDTPTRMQQMSSKDSKKIALFQDVSQQTIASPSGEYWRQYGKAMREV